MLKRIIILSFSILLVSNTLNAMPQPDHKEKEKRIFERIENKLKIIEEKYIDKLGFEERRSAIKDMDKILNLLERLRTLSKKRNDMPGFTLEDTPMSSKSFQKLIDLVNGEHLFKDKLEIIEIATRQNYYTVDQVSSLLDLVAFEDQKIRIIEMTYDKVTDKENNYVLLSMFKFESDKKLIREIFDKYNDI